MFNRATRGKRANNKKTPLRQFVRWRFHLLCVGIVAILLVLLLRVAYLQIINPDMLVKQGDLRSLRVQSIPAVRSTISDRTGRPLAVSVPVDAVWADPKVVLQAGGVDGSQRWQALAQALSLPLAQIKQQITSVPQGRFVYLARQVNTSISDYINQLKLPGIHLQRESRRYYPAGAAVAQLIGVTNIDGVGIEGVEKSFNSRLIGQAGKRVVRKDRYGKVVEDIDSVDSLSAHNLVLSIDERLQALVYRQLAQAVSSNRAESGSAVLVDVNSGEVLAMVNSPSYNPNNLDNVSLADMRNRAITDIFEPGSTVKPMVVMTALQKGIINTNTVIDTHPYFIGKHQIKDVARYDKLSITGILQKSSNVGVSKLALAMPPEVLFNTYQAFGIGQPTNLGLVGESKGLFVNRSRWPEIDRATLAFGYGLMVTPLQLARVYATIGGLGVYRPLSIIKVNQPVPGKRIFPADLVEQVLHMMESVALPGGGGVKAAVPGYRVAIKTGTAKKVGDNGQYIDKYIAYTAGVAPASHPRFALVVIINNPLAGQYYGGAVSAPVFGAIMGGVLRTMNIEPDALPANDKNEFVVDE